MTSWPRWWMLTVVGLLLAGCVRPAPPVVPVQRTTAPPWPAPRDAIAYIDAAGLRHVRLDATDHSHVMSVRVLVDGAAVRVPANIGVDRVRAVQAPVHTHDDSGTAWLEGEGTAEVTLEDFFILWGVRFDRACLGAACGSLEVRADGRPVPEPLRLRLVDVQREIVVSVRRGA